MRKHPTQGDWVLVMEYTPEPWQGSDRVHRPETQVAYLPTLEAVERAITDWPNRTVVGVCFRPGDGCESSIGRFYSTPAEAVSPIARSSIRLIVADETDTEENTA